MQTNTVTVEIVVAAAFDYGAHIECTVGPVPAVDAVAVDLVQRSTALKVGQKARSLLHCLGDDAEFHVQEAAAAAYSECVNRQVH